MPIHKYTVHNTYIITCVYIHIHITHLYKHIYVYIYICIHMISSIYIYKYMYIDVCMYICLFKFNTYTHIHTYTFIYIYIYTLYIGCSTPIDYWTPIRRRIQSHLSRGLTCMCWIPRHRDGTPGNPGTWPTVAWWWLWWWLKVKGR
jgi:hypothetical protein